MARRLLVVIDGYSLLFRAYYGTRYLSTTDGTPTNALYGFLSMTLALIAESKPDMVVVALDPPGRTFRHDLYPEYKGTRRETPDDLKSQIMACKGFIEALGLPALECIGYEADDVIGTLTWRASESGLETVVVTGDLDSLQLVDDKVSVMTTQRGVSETKTYDLGEVFQRYGFEPKLLPDYKAIVGDASDNIPGVPGIGEKGAKEIIQKFGGVESILEKLAELPEKHRKKIEPQAEQMRQSRLLATIVRDVPVEFDFAPLHVSPTRLESAVNMLLRYEFKSHAKRLRSVFQRYMVEGEAGAEARAEPATVDLVREPLQFTLGKPTKDLGEVMDWVGLRPYGLSFEKAQQAQLFGAEEPDAAWVYTREECRQVPATLALELFARFTGQARVADAKPLLRKTGCTDPVGFDASVAAYVLQPSRTSYELDDLAQGYLGQEVREPAQQAAAMLPLEVAMRERLAAEGQTRVLDEIELPLTPILASMETLGIQVDGDQLREFSKQLEVEIQQVRRRVWEMAGEEFNIGSPKQVGEVLFGKMGLPGPKKTSTGYSTGVEVLAELAPAYPIVGEVLTYRELTKLKNTYADALPKMIVNGRIHTSFNQRVAATGRLSSNDPNLQNIPVRTELGRQIRKAFAAAPGCRLGSFDYSQIELRVLAHLCQDASLTRAFHERVDVHAVTAALTYGVPQDMVTKEQRRVAKMLNYAVLYGVTDFGLAQQLGGGFKPSDAKVLIRQYNERFPGVKSFTESVVEEARAKGYTTTVFGRRRYFPDIQNANRQVRGYAERQAMNAPIQGSAADMIKLAMVKLWRELKGRDVRMLLQVHDELVFELGSGWEAWAEPICETMENALPLSVPVEVDGKVGMNWLDMQPLVRG